MTYKLQYISWLVCFAAFTVTALHGSNPAAAAPAMAHDKCRVTGTITTMEKIEIQRTQPDSWLDDWGLPRKYSETKINLDILSIETVEDQPMDKTSCTLEKAAEGYYLKGNSTQKRFFADFDIGDCITAETNFSGDEFRIGNWIYDIKTLPAEQCNTAGKTEDKTE